MQYRRLFSSPAILYTSLSMSPPQPLLVYTGQHGHLLAPCHTADAVYPPAGSAIMFTYQCEMVISRYRNVSAQIFAATFTIGTLYGILLSINIKH